MLRKLILQLSWVLACMATSFSVNAHNNVVVIPLLGDDAPTSKVVFITNEKFTGDLGGPTGADAKCQNEADTLPGSLVKGRKFKALIAGGLSSDISPGRVLNRHDMPYTEVDDTQLGSDFEDMRPKAHDYPATKTAAGQPVDLDEGFTTGEMFTFVWYGFAETGQEFNSNNCLRWTSNAFDEFGGILIISPGTGLMFGDIGGARPFCQATNHLMCVEQ